MARLTAEAIFGADGQAQMRDRIVQLRHAKADLERAARAGIDVSTEREQLDAAEKQLLAIQREYYPNLSVPATS